MVRDLGFDYCKYSSAPYSCDQLVHKLFEEQVARHPGETAVIFGDRYLTYDQLNIKANQVAHALLQYGVQPGDKIGLSTDRGMESVIGMLATLKAGAAYVPLDPAYPAQRLALMSHDAVPAAVLATSTLIDRLPAFECPVVLIDSELSSASENPDVAGLTSRSIAYIIYTSGSTGRPKGVMVEHRNVLALVVNNHFAPIGWDDCVAHCASPSFDATTWEVWAALLNGARLLIAPQATVLDPLALNRLLVQHSVTAMWLTVGLFNQYIDALEEAFSGLKHLLIGGDALVPSFVAQALGKHVPPKRIVNGYGPTETTTFAATFEIKEVAEGTSSIPIGKPIANSCIYILDEERKTVPSGATGEICIGGEGVSRGYLNHPALTAVRFIADPFSSLPGARLYMSGDLGRWTTDGNIEYLGREDLQVKIRGFRIELGEIEAVMRTFPVVKQAVAVARDEGQGVKRLVSYVVLDPSGMAGLPCADSSDPHNAAISRLRDYLTYKLPPHMVPAVIVPIHEVPLTPNGKVDRRALPAPEGRQYLPPQYVAAASSTEATLSGIWKQALKVEHVGVEENFFMLGGDSLMGIEMIGQISESLNIELPFMALFQYPTIRQLGHFVDELMRPMKSMSVTPSEAGSATRGPI